MTLDEFTAVRRVTAESLPGRVMRSGSEAAGRAWTHSGLRSILADLSQRWRMASTVERTRATALMVAVAAAVNVIARLAVPPYSAPGIPRIAIAGIALIAAVVAAWPDHFAAAGPESLLGRLRRSDLKQR